MSNLEALRRALDYPWEKWAVFLHPTQRDLVEQDYNGPARVSGSAGTGKTVVALHRAVHLARAHPQARVLLATFSPTLAHALQTKLLRLIEHEPHLGEQVEVVSMQEMGERLYKPRQRKNPCKSVKSVVLFFRADLHAPWLRRGGGKIAQIRVNP